MKRLSILVLLLSAIATAQQVTWQTEQECSMSWMRSYGCVGTNTLVWVSGEGFSGAVQLTLIFSIDGIAYSKTETVIANDSTGHLTGLFEIPSGAEVVTVTAGLVTAPIRSSRKR